MSFYESTQLRHIEVPLTDRHHSNSLYIACTTARALQYHPEWVVKSDIADLSEYIVLDVQYHLATKQVMYWCKRMANDRPRWRYLPGVTLNIAALARPYWATKRSWK